MSGKVNTYDQFIARMTATYNADVVQKGVDNCKSRAWVRVKNNFEKAKDAPLYSYLERDLTASIQEIARSRGLRPNAPISPRTVPLPVLSPRTKAANKTSTRLKVITGLAVAVVAAGAAYYFIPGASSYVGAAKDHLLNSAYVVTAREFLARMFSKTAEEVPVK